MQCWRIGALAVVGIWVGRSLGDDQLSTNVKPVITQPAGPSAADKLAGLAWTSRMFDQTTSATCFFVRVQSQNADQIVLVTSAHVFNEIKGADCQLALRERRPDGSFARKEIKLAIRDGNKPRWVRHERMDVAAMNFVPPPGAYLVPYEYQQIADESAFLDGRIHFGQEAWIPGFPAKLEANGIGFPVARRGTIASYPLTPVKTFAEFFVEASTFGGDSGAPIVVFPLGADRQNQPAALVAGLVMGQVRQTDKSVMPYEERTVHTPLGVGVIIQSIFIRETIDRLLHPKPEAPKPDAKPADATKPK